MGLGGIGVAGMALQPSSAVGMMMELGLPMACVHRLSEYSCAVMERRSGASVAMANTSADGDGGAGGTGAPPPPPMSKDNSLGTQVPRDRADRLVAALAVLPGCEKPPTRSPGPGGELAAIGAGGLGRREVGGVYVVNTHTPADTHCRPFV